MTGRMQVGVTLRQEQATRDALLRAVEFERAGVDVIGVPEAYGIDAVSQLGWLAARTERARISAQILPIYSRTPTLLAMTAAGLDEVSQGRFVLGLGASGPQVVTGWHGVPYDAPLARTREIVEICQAVWKRDALVHDGPKYRIPLSDTRPLKMIGRPVRDRIPIYIAALGAANVELTAEIADGWLPFMYWPERAETVWAAPLAAGRARRPEHLPPLQVCAGSAFALTSDPQPLRDATRAHVALYVGGMGSVRQNFYNRIVRQYGFPDEAALVQERYLGGDRRGALAALPEQLVEGLSLIGDEAYVRDRLQAFADSGVTVVEVNPVGPDPVAEVGRLCEIAADVRVPA